MQVGHTTAKYKGRVHVGYYMTALVGGHDGTTRNTNGADGSGRHRLFVRLPDVEYKDPVYAWACCSATGGAPAKLLTKVGGGNLTVLKGYLQTRAQQVSLHAELYVREAQADGMHASRIKQAARHSQVKAWQLK